MATVDLPVESGPLMTYEALRASIRDRHDGMSARLRQIAAYALDNPNEMALETVAVVAERARVQPSALIRFAQALGFDGFSDMQRVFRSRLIASAPTYLERLRQHGKPDEGAGSVEMLRHFIAAGHEALDHLSGTIDVEAFERAIELLARGETIHLMAQRRTFSVAAYMAYALSHLGRRVQLIDGVGGMTEQQARNMTDRDTLVAVSFRPYAPDTLAVTRQARERGLAIVAITDAPLSPLVSLATVSFQVADAEVRSLRALTATTCLAVSLVAGLGQRLLADEGKQRSR